MLTPLLALALFAPAAHALNANDVSVLLPLPKSEGDMAELLSPAPLLPRKIFDQLPAIVSDLTPDDLYHQSLKVVALRFDPCFRENGSECQRQIRLVWQPVLKEEGNFTTLDGTIHTFYVLEKAQWEKLLTELRALSPAPGETVTVHPLIAEEGLGGPRWRALKNLVNRYAKRLTRATVMTVNPIGNVWFFSGFDIEREKMRPISIPRLSDTTQGFGAGIGLKGSGNFRAAMAPAPSEDREFQALLRDSAGAQKNLSGTDLREAVRSALLLENPRLTDPGTRDCASCHAAHAVTSWALGNLKLDWENTFAAELFRLKPAPGITDANVLRAFGYFGADPVVARRVQNESELVVEALR